MNLILFCFCDDSGELCSAHLMRICIGATCNGDMRECGIHPALASHTAFPDQLISCVILATLKVVHCVQRAVGTAVEVVSLFYECTCGNTKVLKGYTMPVLCCTTYSFTPTIPLSLHKRLIGPRSLPLSCCNRRAKLCAPTGLVQPNATTPSGCTSLLRQAES